MIAQTLKWVGDINGCLELIDQRLLPAELVKLQCREVDQLYDAIKTLAVRGAPAIGVAAAYGLVIAIQNTEDRRQKAGDGISILLEAAEKLASARPTAVNLFWALDRVRKKAEEFIELLGKHVPVELAENLSRTDKEIIEKKKDSILEAKVKQGSRESYLEISKYPIFDDMGEVLYICSVCRDITDKKRPHGYSGRPFFLFLLSQC